MQIDFEGIKSKAISIVHGFIGGRISRTTFVFRTVTFFAVAFLVAWPNDTILATSTRTLQDAYLAASLAFGAVCLLAFVSAYVKRLHDIGLRGYWAILALVGIPAILAFIADAYIIYRLDLEQGGFSNISDVPMDAMFYAGIGIPLLLGLWKGTPTENRFGQVPVPVENIWACKFQAALMIAAAVILIPTSIYVGLFQSGVWVGRGRTAPSMPMIESNSSGYVLAKCWNLKGVGGGTGEGELGGIYRDGYGGIVLDFVVLEDGQLDIIPAGKTFSKAYRADGFSIYSYGLDTSAPHVSAYDLKRFMIAAVYDGSALPDGNVNFTTFSFAKTGEVWPEWQLVMATGMSLGTNLLLQDREQGRGRLMIGDCIMR